MNPRYLAIKILQRIDETEAYADFVIHHEMAHFEFTEQNKKLINEIVHGTLRWKGSLDWLIDQFFIGKIKKSPTAIRYILEITLYQLNYLDKIPQYAAIHEGVSLAKKIGGDYWAKKVNAILRTFLRKKDTIVYPDPKNDPTKYITVKYSHPEWLVHRWLERYGFDETEQLCAHNNITPHISLRVNQSKYTVETVQKILNEYHIVTHNSKVLPEFLVTNRIGELLQFKPFQDGLFSIQDESAGLVSHLVDPQPNERIIDLCAAPGGKTTHLAELANNQCIIYALDKHYHRLLLIRENVKRLGLSNIHIINVDALNVSGIRADKVLLDTPCSGLGVLSKRSDLRWKRVPDQINELVRLQSGLLNKAAQLLKKNGILIYSTCTIEPEENEQIIQKFLQENSNFEIEPPGHYVDKSVVYENKYIYTYPHKHNMDGSFAVRLIKTKN